MTEPVLSMTRIPVTDVTRTHPLATKSGISLLAHLIEAGQVWSSCTKPQRKLLNELCPPVVDVLVEHGQLLPVDMPGLPFRVTVASRAAMERRGLVDEHGRLTARAVHAWFYTDRYKGGDA